MMKKGFCRSERNKMISGVCGGISEYYGINIYLVRLLFLSAPGIPIYFYLMITKPVGINP